MMAKRKTHTSFSTTSTKQARLRDHIKYVENLVEVQTRWRYRYLHGLYEQMLQSSGVVHDTLSGRQTEN